MSAPTPVVSFVVRVSHTASGRFRGTVERVRTGERQPFIGARGLAIVFTRLALDARRDRDKPRPARRRARSRQTALPAST